MQNGRLSKLVREARESKGISQRELARRTDIDNAEISRIEKGKRIQPNFMALRSLSNELYIDFRELMEAAEYSEEEIEFFLPQKNKDIKLYNGEMWTQEEYDAFLSVKEDGIDLLKVIREFRKRKLNEDEFIYLMSKGLGINIREHFIDNNKKQ